MLSKVKMVDFLRKNILTLCSELFKINVPVCSFLVHHWKHAAHRYRYAQDETIGFLESYFYI